jgi:hypothetical protein
MGTVKKSFKIKNKIYFLISYLACRRLFDSESISISKNFLGFLILMFFLINFPIAFVMTSRIEALAAALLVDCLFPDAFLVDFCLGAILLATAFFGIFSFIINFEFEFLQVLCKIFLDILFGLFFYKKKFNEF